MAATATTATTNPSCDGFLVPQQPTTSRSACASPSPHTLMSAPPSPHTLMSTPPSFHHTMDIQKQFQALSNQLIQNQVEMRQNFRSLTNKVENLQSDHYLYYKNMCKKVILHNAVTLDTQTMQIREMINNKLPSGTDCIPMPSGSSFDAITAANTLANAKVAPVTSRPHTPPPPARQMPSSSVAHQLADTRSIAGSISSRRRDSSVIQLDDEPSSSDPFKNVYMTPRPDNSARSCISVCSRYSRRTSYRGGKASLHTVALYKRSGMDNGYFLSKRVIQSEKCIHRLAKQKQCKLMRWWADVPTWVNVGDILRKKYSDILLWHGMYNYITAIKPPPTSQSLDNFVTEVISHIVQVQNHTTLPSRDAPNLSDTPPAKQTPESTDVAMLPPTTTEAASAATPSSKPSVNASPVTTTAAITIPVAQSAATDTITIDDIDDMDYDA